MREGVLNLREFAVFLDRNNDRGSTEIQKLRKGQNPERTFECRAAIDNFGALPGDTPAWEAEVEAPASMQLALRLLPLCH